MRYVTPYLAAALTVLLTLAAPLDAQRRPIQTDRALTLEVRGGYDLPVGDFSDELGAEADLGFGAGATLMLSPAFGVYGGWSRDMFDCEICEGDEEVRVTGWEAGLTFLLPTDHGITPWARAGAIWHRTNFRFDVADFESDRNVGFQGAVGFDVPVAEWFSVSPAVRFNSLTSDFEFVDTPPIELETTTDVRYVTFDVAAKLHIPRRW